jgi:hypothetical protein
MPRDGQPHVAQCTAAGQDVRRNLLPRVIDLRLRHFEKTKDAAGCLQTVAMWENLKRTDLDSLYKSASTAHQADVEADRSMAWLKQTVAAGYTDAVRMKKDKDRDSLRAREGFKKLVADLEPLTQREKAKRELATRAGRKMKALGAMRQRYERIAACLTVEHGRVAPTSKCDPVSLRIADEFGPHICRFPVISNVFPDTPTNDR